MDKQLRDWLWYQVGLPATCLKRDAFLALVDRIVKAQADFEKRTKRSRSEQ